MYYFMTFKVSGHLCTALCIEMIHDVLCINNFI